MPKQILLSGILFLISLSTFADNAAQSNTTANATKRQKLSQAQKTQVTKIAGDYEKSCLSGPPLPANASKTIKMVVGWSTDPSICRCTATRLQEAFTPEVFSFNNEQYDLFQRRFAENEAAECSVPIMKAHITESCEQFLGTAMDEMSTDQKEKRLKELGYKDTDSLLKESCACIRSEIKDITPRQWVLSSMAHYQAYLKRKQSGITTEAAPTTPLDAAMNVCLKRQSPIEGRSNGQ